MIPTKFDFNDLIVLDLANNHQGDIKHALNIIKSMGEVVRKHGVKVGIKFQFRQMDSFIHPDHHEGSDNKHIPRFLATRLTNDEYKILFNEIRAQGLLTICTPFDEESVDIIEEFDFDVIKIASCSATDWPLLQRVSEANKPIIFSTGGILLPAVDSLVSFFDHRGNDYAIMHCVSIYPTPDELCNLANIATLKQRYTNRVIGWSTHEDPNDTAPVMIAAAQGAQMFERHIGMNTETTTLNAYSSTPEQVDKWIEALLKAKSILGSQDRLEPQKVEIDAINSLQRGVFAKVDLNKGDYLTRDNVFFAMPYSPGQLTSGTWSDAITLNSPIKAKQIISMEASEIPAPAPVTALKTAVHEVKSLLNLAGVKLNSEFEIEYSNHYGYENFQKCGVVIINCINREYCKKILVQLAGQVHPLHYHKRKEETFQVLSGELKTELDGVTRTLQPGDTQLVMPGVWHRFWTDTGCVFEEVSSTHYNNDSVYQDPKIAKMERAERKTVVDHWGRFQLLDEAKIKR